MIDQRRRLPDRSRRPHARSDSGRTLARLPFDPDHHAVAVLA